MVFRNSITKATVHFSNAISYSDAFADEVSDIIAYGSEEETLQLLGKLSYASDSRFVPLILPALQNNSPAIRALAADVLGRLQAAAFGRDKHCDAVVRLKELTYDTISEVRRSALTALALIKEDTALALFVCALDDDDHQVRLVAAQAFQNLQYMDALPGLVNLLNDEWIDIQEAAVSALCNMLKDANAAEECLNVLINTLFNHQDSDIRNMIAIAFGDAGLPDVTTPLIAVLQNEDEEDEIRGSAAMSLGLVGDQTALPALVKCIEHNALSIRIGAVFAVGRIAGNKYTDLLIKVLQTDEPAVQRRALYGLADVSGIVAVKAIFSKLEDPAIREDASGALKQLYSEASNQDIHVMIVEALLLMKAPDFTDLEYNSRQMFQSFLEEYQAVRGYEELCDQVRDALHLPDTP